METDNLPAPMTESGVAKTKHTLLDLVSALSKADDELASKDFDPAELVQAVRDKVDAIHAIIGRMNTVAGWLKEVAKPLQSKASALLANKQRLEDYVTHALLTEAASRVGDEAKTSDVSLPGNAFKVRLRDSPPALQIDRPATVDDYMKYPGYVTRKSVYEWDTDRIRRELKDGNPMPEAEVILNDQDPIPVITKIPLPARLTRGHWSEFVANVPDSIEPKTKRRGKK